MRVVILRFTSSPGTATIRAVGTWRRTRLQSSVARISPAASARAYARASMPTRNDWGVWPRRNRARSGISVTRSPSTITRVSALGMTVSVPSARPDRMGSIERRTTSTGTSGRTASWIRTTSSSSAASAARPLRVLRLRVSPPATISTGMGRSTAPTSARVSASQSAWVTTTSVSTPAATIARMLRIRMGSPARRTNCFGISAPKRSPVPPASTMAWMRIERRA